METSYDPMAMPYLPSPMPFTGHNMQNMDYMSVPSMVDMQDQYSNFDSEAYMSGDEFSFAPSGGLQHPAMLKRFSSGFEDPFTDSNISPFDQPMEGLGDNHSIDRDSKYLSFSMPQYNFTLLDDGFRRSSVNINAQLHGMFFLAESQWPATADNPPPPPELTCYRRNLFQITGSITLPRNLRYVFTDDGSRIPIYELELAVSSTESVEGNPVKIISVPWKTPSGTEASKPEDKIEKEPPTIPLDKMSGQDLDTDFTTFPIQWKRLQFRIATANNGRRKELQQHFTLHLKIMASLSTGGKISIAEAHSGAVIVRGRSPRNFAARKDVPLSSSSTARKHIPSISRNSISTTSVPQITSAPRIKSPPDEVPQMVLQYENNELRSPDESNMWQQNTVPEPLLTPTYTSSVIPPVPPFVHDPSPDIPTPSPFPFSFAPDMNSVNGPQSLHFSEEENSPFPPPQQSNSRQSSRPPTSNPSPSLVNKPRTSTYPNVANPEVPPLRPRMHSHQASTSGVSGFTGSGSGLGLANASSTTSSLRPELGHKRASLPFSPGTTNVDGLYEYIPLSVEDWLPPVDAVFRPHVVHHEAPIPTSAGPLLGRTSSKRYFSEVA